MPDQSNLITFLQLQNAGREEPAKKVPYTAYHCSDCGVIVAGNANECGHCGSVFA